MARSIHSTRRALDEARRWEYADARRKHDDVWLVEDALTSKRRYKHRVRRHRTQNVPSTAHPWDVPVIRSEEHPHIRHALSADDVRELLQRVPADVRPDLNAVHLRSGFREADILKSDLEPDPVTGRPGNDLGGGIYAPYLMGRYRFEPCEIDLYGFAYEADALRVPEIQLPLLWLIQAGTLAHEIAHCWDERRRAYGDRWALDETERGERYAEQSAQTWLVSSAVSYFVERYPDRATAFESWSRAHLGVAITVKRAADDADRAIWGMVVGLLDVCGRWEAQRELELRVDVAEQFHFVDDFAPARQILESVLASRPDDVRATILVGDIAVHEGDWPVALDWTSRALSLAPDSLDAHEDRIDALMGSAQWPAAIDACETALRLDFPARRNASIKLELIRSLIESGDSAKALDIIDQLTAEKSLTARHHHWAWALRAEALLRQGRWDEAHAVAKQGLSRQPYALPKAVMRVAAWEAATRSSCPPADPPTASDIEYLRSGGRGSWADRLLAEGLSPVAPRMTQRASSLGRKRRGRLLRL